MIKQDTETSAQFQNRVITKPGDLQRDTHVLITDEYTCQVPADVSNNHLLGAILVEDYSLAGAGILPNDIVVCVATHKVTTGQLASVQTRNGILLRFLEPCENPLDGEVTLVAANPDYPDTYHRWSDITIWGIALCVDRPASNPQITQNSFLQPRPPRKVTTRRILNASTALLTLTLAVMI